MLMESIAGQMLAKNSGIQDEEIQPRTDS